MANIIYGRFIMNARKFLEVKICTTMKRAVKWINDPRYTSHKIVTEDLIVVFLKKRYMKITKSHAIGFAILELSKFHMYESYYGFIQPRLGGYNRVSIVLTDTDSFLLHIKGLSREQIWLILAPMMDFSNYDKDDRLYSEARKAIPGYFKDENAGTRLLEVVALKSKCYALRTEGKSDLASTTKCKGIVRRRCRDFTLQMYRDCLLNYVKMSTEFTAIRAKAKQPRTVALRKVALTSFDNKRLLRNCGIHSAPYGVLDFNPACNECQVNEPDGRELRYIKAHCD